MMKQLQMSMPTVSSYPFHANMTSILPQHPSFENWLFTNYVQLRIDTYMDLDNPSNNEVYYLDFYQPLMREYHPLLNIHSIRKDTIKKNNINIIELFIESINLGNYIYVLIDKKYISAYKSSESSPHDLFIYGYDLKRNTFQIADFFPNSLPMYSFSEASFEELAAAVNINNDYDNDPWDNVFGVQFIGINQWKVYDFNIEYLIQSLKDYINSTKTAVQYELIVGKPLERPELHGSKNSIFGMNVYNKLCEQAEFRYMYLRAIHVLYEHKKIMISRIQYMGKIGLIDEEKHILSFIEIQQRAESIRNIVIKYMSLNDNSKIIKLVSMIKELESLEFVRLNELLRDLSN